MTKDLRGGHNSNSFSLLDIYLDEEGPSVKIQLLNFLKNHHIVAKTSPTTVAFMMNGRYLLAFGQNFILPMVNTSLIKRIFSNVSMSVKFCNFLCHKCTWCSWQHLNQPNLLVRAVFRFHVYFHVRLVLHDLGIFLAHKDGFGKVKISYIKIAYYSICDDYGVNADETWMHGDWFYTTGDGIFRYEVKVTKTTPPDNLKR